MNQTENITTVFFLVVRMCVGFTHWIRHPQAQAEHSVESVPNHHHTGQTRNLW
jgi:hypothetical protein